MIKFVALVLIFGVLLAGCGMDMEELVFLYNGQRVVMNVPAGDILGALGEPKAVTEEASCAFPGVDKTYNFGSFCITTYPSEEGELMGRLWFLDDSVATAEGIRIGDSREVAAASYGAGYWQSEDTCIVTTAKTRLTVLLKDDRVYSIQYEAILE